MYNIRQWPFVADMNYSGSITISDIWLWMKWLYFYPGDGIIYIALKFLPDIARFFEITHAHYGGILSAIISVALWLWFMEICGRWL